MEHPYYPPRATSDKMYDIIQHLVHEDNKSPYDYYEWPKKITVSWYPFDSVIYMGLHVFMQIGLRN